MALGVILLNMSEIRRILSFIVIPVHVLQPITQHWIRVPDRTEITLEVLNIDGIETDERGIGADIEFGHV